MKNKNRIPFIVSSIIVGISFFGTFQLIQLCSIQEDLFAQRIKKEIYPFQSFYKHEENLVSIFWWDYGRKSMKPEGVKDEIEPIFINQKGQFIDPSEEAERVGFETFSRKWFEGKIYPVYFRGREVGSLSNFSMKVGYTGVMKRCKDELWGEAIYKGKDTGGEAFGKEIGNTGFIEAGASLFALAKKEDLFISKEIRPRSLTTEMDVKRMKDAGKFEFKKMIQRLRKPAKDVEVDGEWTGRHILWSIDLNGDYKLDLIGEFEVLLRFKYFGSQKINTKPAQLLFTLIYIQYDNGNGEIVWPSFQNGIWLDGASSIVGFFNLGESRPAILVRSRYPTTFHHYQSESYQYELIAYLNEMGWVTIFKGRPKRYCM